MAVSRLLPSGGANDFNVALTGSYTTVTFTKEYAPGGYSIVSSVADATIDIYSFNADGSSAGYTGTKSFTASKGFSKMVILGGTAGDLLSFSYKQTFISANATAEVLAGPVIESASTITLPILDATTVITGRNFATDIQAVFTSANTSYTATAAKSLTRNSATSLTITRPDNLLAAYNPYTLTLTNPGISAPIGSNSHIISGITAGSTPVWSTAAGSLGLFQKNVAFSTTLVATDADAGALSYTLQSGTLPAGLSLSSSTGVISGTPSSGTTASFAFTVRVTDTGGNFVDRAFTLANFAPVWVTTGALTGYGPGGAYSYQLVITEDDSATFALASGSLPTGLSLSSSGLISGAAYAGNTVANYTFTVTATDSAGNSVTSGSLSIQANFFTVGTSFTFTTAGVTGRNGPSLAQCQSAYSATAWAQLTANLNMTTNGVQRWTVPATGVYAFSVAGARGGQDGSANGGSGRIISGNVSLTANEVINIVCGQPGNDAGGNGGGGGGGGTFVYTGASSGYADSDLLFAAGAGSGGNNGSGNKNGQDGLASNSSSGGTGPSYTDGIQNTLGQGGNRASHNNYGAAGGAGFLSGGAAGYDFAGPKSGGEGWVGGPCMSSSSGTGGFGGGGGSTNDCGGSGAGAGYTGGGGSSCYEVSGAGGSKHGTRVTSAAFGSTNYSSGFVTVTRNS
jgi:hypothetical protein